MIPWLMLTLLMIGSGAFRPVIAQLSSYKADVISFIYEDGSIARRITLNYSIDEKDAALAKRMFFVNNGYSVHDFAVGDNFLLVAERVKPPEQAVLNDGFSHVQLRVNDNRLSFADKFSTEFIRQDIAESDLKDDLATAKVMLADLEYSFYAIFPGRISESSSGEIRGDTTVWKYDVEQLLHHDRFEMTAVSVVDRADGLIWYVFLIGCLLTTIAVLLFVKTHLKQTGPATGEKAVA